MVKTMAYEALARRWRPKKFTEVVGQKESVKALVNALDSDRLHHAYLFSGPRGVGKTTIARIFAKSLNCAEGITSEPCGKCPSCLEIDGGNMIDLIEVDAASRTKVEETRQLLDNVQYAPTRSRFKIYLIDEVHMLSKHSFNALLKTLEEPPPHVKFLLATTDPEKLPVTVLSRCLKFGLKKVGTEIIVSQLEKILTDEGIPYDKESISYLARASDGSVRDALSLLDQAIVHGKGQLVSEETVKMLGLAQDETIFVMLNLVSAGEGEQLLNLSKQLAAQGSNYELVMNQMLQVLRRVAVLQIVGNAVDGYEEHELEINELAQVMSPENCQLFYEIILQGLKNLEISSDYETGFEMTLLRLLAFKPDTLSSENPLKALVNNETVRFDDAPVEESIDNTASGHPNVVQETDLGKRWAALIKRLSLTGLPGELARNSTLQKREGRTFYLEVSSEFSGLIQTSYVEAIAKAVSDDLKMEIKVEVAESDDSTSITLAKLEKVEIANKKELIEKAMNSNPNIERFKSVFDAKLETLKLKSES